jgi:hypothetical protein
MPSLLRLAHSSSSHSLRANNKHQANGVSKPALARGPVSHDAAHDRVGALHVERDGAGRQTAQDCARVRGERVKHRVWRCVLRGGRGTYAHALGFAGEGEGGEDVEGAVGAAHTHLQSWGHGCN